MLTSPLLYVLVAESLACTIRADNNIVASPTGASPPRLRHNSETSSSRSPPDVTNYPVVLPSVDSDTSDAETLPALISLKPHTPLPPLFTHGLTSSTTTEPLLSHRHQATGVRCPLPLLHLARLLQCNIQQPTQPLLCNNKTLDASSSVAATNPPPSERFLLPALHSMQRRPTAANFFHYCLLPSPPPLPPPGPGSRFIFMSRLRDKLQTLLNNSLGSPLSSNPPSSHQGAPSPLTSTNVPMLGASTQPTMPTHTEAFLTSTIHNQQPHRLQRLPTNPPSPQTSSTQAAPLPDLPSTDDNNHRETTNLRGATVSHCPPYQDNPSSHIMDHPNPNSPPPTTQPDGDIPHNSNPSDDDSTSPFVRQWSDRLCSTTIFDSFSDACSATEEGEN